HLLGADERIGSVLDRLDVGRWARRFHDVDALLHAVGEQPPHVLIVGSALAPSAAARLRGWLSGGRQPVGFPVLLTGLAGDDRGLDGWESLTESTPLSLVREPELLLDRLSLMLHI